MTVSNDLLSQEECALTIAKHEQALESWRLMNEIVLVTRVKIEQSRALIVWVDAMVGRR
jgi:hypothetical protein